MKKFHTVLLLAIFLIVGCTKETEDQTLHEMEKPLEVFILNDESVQVNEMIELLAQVKYGETFVNDANEVKFEVWESGLREQGITLEASYKEEGIYQATHKFDHDGVYYMYAHTTARGMHTMPKMKFIVGSPDMSKVLEDHATNEMHGMEEASDEESHGHK